ncbi:MFS transporter [Variovorax rhizosphaerae]|uniref:MFS transporter n=1 Tax=Variovorax rhizosphaerae TaxID=1836200 RepID=A0ABU8WQK6_9BURK
MHQQGSGRFEVGGKRASYVLFICAMLHAMCSADWQILAVLIEPMRRDMGLNDTQVGLVSSVYFLGVILFVIPLSYLVDVWSRKNMLGLMAIFWSTCTMLTGAASGFVFLLVARLGVGIGEAGFGPGSTALVSASYPEDRRARKLGILNAFITVGVVLGLAIGGYVSTHYGWRTSFQVLGIAGIGLGILAFFMQDYSLQKEDGRFVHGSLLANLRELAGIRTLRWLCVGLGMNAVMQVSVSTWLPALLMRAYDIHEDKAGYLVGAFTIVGLVGPILGGIAADRWQRRCAGGRMRLAAVAAGMAAVFLWLSLAAGLDLHNRALMYFSVAMMSLHSICVGMAFPAAAATVQDMVPARSRSLAWGASIAALFLLGGAWGPLLVGTLSDEMGSDYLGIGAGLAATGIFGLLASGIWWITARHMRADSATVQADAAPALP